jgi:hypothetical protein
MSGSLQSPERAISVVAPPRAIEQSAESAGTVVPTKVDGPKSSGPWDTVSAIASMLSAIAAAYAVYQTVKSGKDQRSWRKADRRSAHFVRSVVTPLDALLPLFLDRADDRLKQTKQKVDTLSLQRAAHADVQQFVGEATIEYQEEFFQTKARVNVILKCWGDTALIDDVNEKLRDFEDRSVDAFKSLCTPNGPSRIGEELRTTIGRINQVLVEYDLRCD